MSISPKQEKKVNKYFRLLVKQFIKDRKLHKKIKILFEEQEIEGLCYYKGGFYYSCFWDKNFKSEKFLCEVVSHEFTHIHFLINEGDHEHDERFYSRAEHFEEWLRKNKGK